MARFKGVDISHHQGDGGMPHSWWDELKKCGVQFVIIKITQGSTYVDPAADENFHRARARGFDIGFYHFMDGTPGTRQSDHFLAEVKRLTGDKWSKYLLAGDVERNPNPGGNAGPAEVLSFFSSLERHATDNYRVIYSNHGQTGNLGISVNLAGKVNGIWYASWPGGAHYCNNLNLPAALHHGPFLGLGTDYDIWQYGSMRFAGHALDGNVFDGSREHYEQVFGNAPGSGGGGGGGSPGPTPKPPPAGGGLLGDLQRDLQGLLGGIGGILGDIVKKIVDGIGDTVRDILNVIGRVLGRALDIILDVVRKAIAAARDIVEKLLARIGDIAGDLLRGAERVIGQITGGIRDIIQNAADTAANIAQRVQRTIQDTLRDGLNALGDVIGKIVNGAGHIIGEAVDTVSNIKDTAVSFIRDILEQAAATLRDIGERVSASIGDLLGDIAPVVNQIVATLQGLPDAVAKFAQDVADGITGPLQDIGKGLGEFLTDPIGGILGGFFEGPEKHLVSLITDTLSRLSQNEKAPADVRKMARGMQEPEGAIFALGAIIILPLIIGPLVTRLLEPALQVMTQEEARIFRPQMLSLADGINAIYRGKRDEAWLLGVGAQLGYEDEDIRLAIETSRPLPTPDDVAVWQHRGLMTGADAKAEITQLGYDSDTAERMLKAAEVLPGVSDTVRFAVREAFPGQVQYEATAKTTPESFLQAAVKVGLGEQNARSYWAAHWELPGLGNVFDMFHRGIINRSVLEQYLVAADVHPDWRDRLVKLSFSTLTRVDIRRMHSIGVISDSEVVRAYQDIGYSPEDAQAQLEFVKELESGVDDTGDTTERDLTRSDLVGAYEDGILKRNQAKDSLIEIGYSATESELILDRSDVKIGLAERKETRASIIEQAVASVITYEQAQDALHKAGLATEEIALSLDAIDKGKRARFTRVSRTDLVKMFKASLITEVEFVSELANLGYREPWTTRLVALSKTKTPPTEA